MSEIVPQDQAGLVGLDAIRKMPVADAEKELLKHEQVNCPVFHRFGPGVYMRETHFPKGTLAIGHSHKHEHTNIILKGRLVIIHPDGTTTECVAPTVFKGYPGRKAAYFFEDTVWMNIHPTEETDIEKLEEIFIEKSDAYLESEALRTAERLQKEGE